MPDVIAGWFALPRGWRDNPAIRKAPRFTEHEAFAWAIEHAAFAPHDVTFAGRVVHLERGQLVTSLREMAVIFGWSRKEVRGVLKRFGTAQIWAHQRAHFGTLITICDFEELQGDRPSKGHTKGQAEGTPRAHLLLEQGKQGKTKIEDDGADGAAADDDPVSRYAFEGSVIRVKPDQLERWRQVFPAIPDLQAELYRRDEWLADQPYDKRSRWFHSTVSYLAKLNREIQLAERSPARLERMDGPAIV